MIELSSDEIAILGRPNFSCARIAQILIASGMYKKGESKAEYEQAVYIHWASGLLKKHGENWLQVRNETLRNLRDTLADKSKSETTNFDCYQQKVISKISNNFGVSADISTGNISENQP